MFAVGGAVRIEFTGTGLVTGTGGDDHEDGTGYDGWLGRDPFAACS